MDPVHHDLRHSDKHQALLGTPGTLAYLPHALRWALSAEVILFSLVFGIPVGLFAGSLVGMWLVVPLACGIVVWLLAVLARAVWGYGDPPRPDTDQLITIGPSAWRLLLLTTLILFVNHGLHGSFPTGSRVFAYGIGALLPAMLALLAVEDGLLDALNPFRLLRVTVAGGPVGWMLTVVSAWTVGRALLGFVHWMTEFQIGSMIEFVPRPGQAMTVFIGIWAFSLLMHLYGHALHHRHEAAGLGVMLEGDDEDERLAERCAMAVERTALAMIAALERDDRIACHQLAATKPPEGVDKLVFLSDLWERLCLDRKYPVALLVAKRLIPEAVRRKRYTLAQETLAVARRESPSFDPGVEVP